MAGKRKEIEEEEVGGAPEWMVTFSDCMTLLLTFFVLLLSFATFGPQVLPNLGASLAAALPTIGLSRSTESESLYKDRMAEYREKVKKGSEFRTLAEELSEGVVPESKPLDFRNMKVFTVPSSKVFWGNGSQISAPGKDMLAALGFFLRAAPSRVVVSEHGPGTNENLGLARSWAILEYLTTSTSLTKEDFSITASTMIRHSRSEGRVVEITLLERSVYE